MRILFFVLLSLVSVTLTAQRGGCYCESKWDIVVNLGAGHLNSVYKVQSQDNSNLIKDKLQLNGDISMRYSFSRFYIQPGIGFSSFATKYIPTANSSEKRNLQTITIPIILGFNYKNDTRLYPLAEVGFIPNFVLDYSDKSVDAKEFFPSFVGKMGAGYELSERTSIEIKATYLQTTNVLQNDYKASYKSIGGQIALLVKI